MKEMKEAIKSKVFTINEFILKNIKNIDLDLNEFLLILFFINVSNTLNIKLINKYLNLSEEEILNVFNSLINKKLIEIVVKKNGKQLEEEISLEIFYDKLILSSDKKENKETDIFSIFENEFGRTLSPIEYETINGWLENRIGEDLIKKALKEAVLNGVTNLRYIDKIIYEWNKNKIRSSNSKEEIVELFDYNWLEESNEKR